MGVGGEWEQESHSRTPLLHWLQVHHRIDYKLAVMTYKIHHSSRPAYLSRHIKLRQSARSLSTA